MKESIEKILNFVSETCDLTKEEILSHNRTMPLPLVRGFFWYLIRRTTGYSNLHIAQATSHNGYTFTQAGVGSSIGRIMDAISHDKLWAARWAKAVEALDLKRMVAKDEEITLTMTVPKGMRNKIKFDIKEKSL